MSSSKGEEEDRKIIDKLYETVVKTNEYKILRHVLNLLVENVESSESAKGFLRLYAPSLQNRLERSKKLLYFFREDSKLQNGELVTLRKAFVYLGLFETSLTNVVDLILMFFIAIHHDLYDFWARRYAKSPDDLDRISLSQKLVFLNHHNLQVFSENINRTLRNKVAHMDFEIEPDGKILVKNQRYDLEDEIHRLMAFL